MTRGNPLHQEWLRLRTEEGLTYLAIAKRYGVTDRAVSNACYRLGVPARRLRPLTNEDVDRFEDLYRQGLSNWKIGRTENRCRSVVRYYLERRGIEVRNRRRVADEATIENILKTAKSTSLTYQQIADKFGVTINAVAGAIYQARHARSS